MLKNVLSLVRRLDVSARSIYGDTPLRFVKYLYISLFRFNRFVVLCLSREDPLPCSSKANDRKNSANMRLEEWSIDTLREYRAGKDLPKEFYMDALRGLRRPWVILRERQVAFIGWSCEPVDQGRFLRLEKNEAEVAIVLSLPEFRRQGLFRAGMEQLIAALFAEGNERVFGVAHSGNTNSLNGLYSLGMRRVGHVYALGQLHFKKSTRQMEGLKAGPAPESAPQSVQDTPPDTRVPLQTTPTQHP